MKKISFCIPCYRSEKTIKVVIDEIHSMMNQKADKFEHEIVCVIDGSPDNVFSVLKNIATEDQTVKVVNLSKNFGQANARMATLRYASGDYIVCMDDDGQCPMDKIWELVEPLFGDYDVAIAAYPHKKQSLFKNFGSRVNDKMIHSLLDVPKDFQMSNFFAMRKFISDYILKYHNPYPYVTGLLSETTASFAYVEMEERDRMSGTTGYTLKKLLQQWFNGFTSFSVKPLRVADFLGLVCSAIGFIVAIVTIARKLLGYDIELGYSSIFAAIMVVGGILMVLMGLIGEYVGRIFICINDLPQYVVKDTVNIEFR